MIHHYYLQILNFDGYNVGFRDSFSTTWLEFDSYEEALRVAKHWEKWMSK